MVGGMKMCWKIGAFALLIPLLHGCGDSRSVRLGREAMGQTNYPSAIHYFEQALRRNPTLRNADEIQMLIYQCKSMLTDEQSRLDEKIQQEILSLKKENTRLRKENKELRDTGTSTPGTTIPHDVLRKAEKAAQPKPAAKTAAAPKAEPVHYTVASGDTFTGISKKFYGSAGKWQLILDANRDQVKDARNLRAGMTLVIPPAE